MTCQRKRKMQIAKKKNKEKLTFAHFLCWLKCAKETPIVQPKVPDNSKQDLLQFPSTNELTLPLSTPATQANSLCLKTMVIA